MSSIPTDRKYTQTHEWFKAEGDIVTIGITQYAADELTDITFVDLPDVGSSIEPGVACGEIESVKATSELFSAVGGKVVEINSDLEDQPELVNNDPFEAGWMLKVQADDLSPLDNLMDPSTYEQMLGES
jgi:glycine cleavage system H protein